MNTILLILLVVTLVILFIQDIKHRLVHVGLLILLLFITLVYWYINNFEIRLLLFNFAFIIVNLGSLKLYTIMTKKEKTDDLIYGLGLGDILFFIAITPLFSTLNYILFFISGLFVSMLTHLLVSIKTKNKLIPLAGYLSIYLVCFIGYFKYLNKSFYIDLLLLN